MFRLSITKYMEFENRMIWWREIQLDIRALLTMDPCQIDSGSHAVDTPNWASPGSIHRFYDFLMT